MRGFVLGLGVIGVLLGLALPAQACPLCRDAIASSEQAEEFRDNPLQEARAYNYSIYLMVGMPYLLLCTVGFLIYRSYRKRPTPSNDQGDASCPLPSPDGPF